jgi:hypothetical protein
MPRQVLEFRVIVASPSELYDTRKAVFEVIQELNRTFEAQGVSIRGLGWEEYATPGIGSEAQEVIGAQLLRDYDILIALFATRLGTPTERHLSGTVEEIEHAIANTGSSMGRYRVQIYFKDRIESASSISIDELAKLADFRKQLEPRGVLYKLFKDDDHLRPEIRVNLQRPILEYLKNRSIDSSSLQLPLKSADPPSKSEEPNEARVEHDEFGILDQAEVAEKSIELSVVSINRINELILEIGAETNKQVAEMENTLISNASAAQKKDFINNFAGFLKSKASALEQEARVARVNFNLFTDAIVVIAGVQKESELSEQYKEELAVFLGVAETMLNSLVESRSSVVGFRNAVANIPRITVQFNQAKRLLLHAIDECLAFFDEVERGIFEVTAKT